MRYALVDKNDVVVNVIELEPHADYTPADGLHLEEGRDYPKPDPIEETQVAPSFLARDFFALLTVQDYTNILAACSQSPAMGLLWDSLKAQGDAPIITTSERFLAGWAGLKGALGADRSAAIGAALGIPVGT
jgi:hypothetical protein